VVLRRELVVEVDDRHAQTLALGLHRAKLASVTKTIAFDKASLSITIAVQRLTREDVIIDGSETLEVTLGIEDLKL
jgi:hypothetical protein